MNVPVGRPCGSCGRRQGSCAGVQAITLTHSGFGARRDPGKPSFTTLNHTPHDKPVPPRESLRACSACQTLGGPAIAVSFGQLDETKRIAAGAAPEAEP